MQVGPTIILQVGKKLGYSGNLRKLSLSLSLCEMNELNPTRQAVLPGTLMPGEHKQLKRVAESTDSKSTGLKYHPFHPLIIKLLHGGYNPKPNIVTL